VEFTDEFETWWDGLTADEQLSVEFYVELLIDKGVALGSPYSSQIKGSRHGHMRELRAQHQGRPYRVLYAFDPKRHAILLIGGDKGAMGNRWYEVFVPIADSLYDEHLTEVAAEQRAAQAKGQGGSDG
jgi:hypothetical protein